MREYFIIGVISILLVYLTDLRLKTRLFYTRRFWIFQIIVAVLTTLVDNYSSGRPFVFFNEQFVTGIRVFSVPLENYVFGFSLLALNIVLYEYFRRGRES